MMYPEWYYNNKVKFEMIRFTKNRQLFLGVPKYLEQGQRLTKWHRCHNVQSLNYVFDLFNIRENKYNCFVSLAEYTEVPYRYRSFGEWKHDNLSIPNWNSREDNWKYVKSFDFLVDIDAPAHKDIDFAYYSAKEICKFFDGIPVKYTVRFSGRGFHIIIPDEQFNIKKSYDLKDKYSIYKVYAKLGNYLYKEYSELVDLRIYVSRCKIKLPLSLSLYQDSEYMCVPLGEDDFEKFKLEKMKPELWLSELPFVCDYYRNSEHGSGLRLLKRCGLDKHASKLITV